MANNDPAQMPIWLELIIDRAADQVRISALGSRGEKVAFRKFGVEPERLERFAAGMERAAKHEQPLTSELLADAHAIHEALTESGIGVLLGRYAEAAKGPLLVRFSIHDDKLQAVPWEAACNPAENHGFWGVLPNLLPVRGVISDIPWTSAVVEGAVRILAIAPTETGTLVNLKAALTERIETGEVQWLDSLEGPNTTKRAILQRLRQEPTPHVLHFVGHGRMDGGVAALRAADDAGEEVWLDVESLAQEIAANLRGKLQLVILEACDTARQTTFASAAEIIAQAGVEAVVAHSWPVKANIAQLCSTALYKTLAGTGPRAGNIAIAMNDARRAIQTAADASAETMSPVLYLRGPNGAIFNFEKRKLTPVILTGVGAAIAGAGAIIAKTAQHSTPSVADVVRPEPVPVEPTIPDKPTLESSTGQQTYDAPAHKAPIPKETPPPKVPRSNTNPTSHPRIGPEPPPHRPSQPPPQIPTIPPSRPSEPRIVITNPPPSPPTMMPPKAGLLLAGGAMLTTAAFITYLLLRPGPVTVLQPRPFPTFAPISFPYPPVDAGATPIPKPPDAGPFKVKLEIGQSCSVNSNCKSKFCIDGVCCESSCEGACRACSVDAGSSANGVCKNVPQGQDPARECGALGTCSGQGTCRSICSPKAPCAIPLLLDGSSCTNSARCQSGFCVDGVCCENECTGLCRACSKAAGSPRDGVCRPVPYSETPSNECPVNNRCNGKGQCTPIPG